MKIKIQNKNSEVVVEIPSHVNLRNLSLGEKFNVYLFKEKNEKIPVEACLIADGRSLLVQNSVVRLRDFKNLRSMQWSFVRTVEPKIKSVSKGLGDLKSPMTGKIISVNVKNDDVVRVGDVLLIIEAMKMENRILAEGDGIVKNIKMTIGANVVAGDNLLTLVEQG